jgi:two-component system CheB/CheR fusion protein
VWDWALTPIIDQNNLDQVQYMLVSAVEVTHQVRVREEIERLDRLKDEFLSLASHELRTPLTPLMGFADLLARLLKQQQTTPDENRETRIRHAVGSIQQQLRRLNRLIEDLLDVARLQSGKFTLKQEQIDVEKLLEQAASEARMLSAEHTIRLHLPEGDEPLSVTGDPERLLQVVMNLVQNATKYAPAHKEIDIYLRRVHDEARDQDMAQIDVQDRGLGIAPQVLPSIFDRFYQVARDNRGSRSGLGLGLFICKQLVEQHGGTIGVASELGKSSVFSVRLPLS